MSKNKKNKRKSTEQLLMQCFNDLLNGVNTVNPAINTIAVNPNANLLDRKDTESRYHEQSSSVQNIFKLIQIIDQQNELENAIHKMEKDIKRLKEIFEKNENKLEKLYDKYNLLASKNHQLNKSQKKSRQQIVYLQKIIQSLGMGMGMNKSSDSLKKIAENFENSLISFYPKNLKTNKELYNTER